MRRIVTIISVLLVVALQVAHGATVRGQVTDASGNPVSHALVQALERPQSSTADGIVGSKLNPWVQADDQGRFQLQLAPGRYKLLAKDEIDGYPDPLPLLNEDRTAQFPEITVSTQDVTDVKIALGQPGGSIFGQVLDSTSGKPVPGAQVLIVDANDPQAYVKLTTDAFGRFSYTVLSKQLRVSGSARGYAPAGPQQDIHLAKGEKRQVTIGVKRK